MPEHLLHAVNAQVQLCTEDYLTFSIVYLEEEGAAAFANPFDQNDPVSEGRCICNKC